MSTFPAALLNLGLLGYVAGAVAGLLFLRAEKAANVVSFGFASLGSLCSLVSCVTALAQGTTGQSVELFHSLLPYVQFTVKLDPLGAFFGVIVSLLGLALSL